MKIIIKKRKIYNGNNRCVGIWFFGRKEYSDRFYSIWYNPSNAIQDCVRMFVKQGESLDNIYFPDNETRVEFFNSLPLDVDSLIRLYE